MDLPFAIVLKQNILVELVGGKFDIDDGLVNGAEDIFIDFTSNGIDIVWIEFSLASIGAMQCMKMQKNFASSTPCTWTPITRITRKITSTSKKYIIQQEFPIQ